MVGKVNNLIGLAKMVGGWLLIIFGLAAVFHLAGCANLERDKYPDASVSPEPDANVSYPDATETPDVSTPPDASVPDACVPECSCDNDCDHGEACYEGKCYEKCWCDAQCDNGERCRHGICR